MRNVRNLSPEIPDRLIPETAGRIAGEKGLESPAAPPCR
jgi:hypothetical protein